MCFKVDFINFFRRSLRFGAILSDRFDHILIGEKIDIWMKIVKMGDFVSVISPWKRSPRLKFGGPKCTFRTGQEDGWENKRKKSFLKGKFCCAKSPIFLLFLAHFWVDTRYVGWTSGCQQLKGSNCSISLVFLCHFWQLFFVIFGNFFGFHRYFIAFFAILSVFLGRFFGIQDVVLPVAPIGE